MIKIVLLLCRSRYRKQTLNNFSRNSMYGNFLLLSFCGPLFFYLGKLLHKLNIFKSISIDGLPIIKDKTKGINFWFGGTNLKIPKNFLVLNNNKVNMKNVFKLKNQKDEVFQLYPIIRNKLVYSEKKRKIIYISSIKKNLSNKSVSFWNKYKRNFLKDFSFFNTSEVFNKQRLLNDNEKFQLYREIQTLIRLEIITKLKKVFKSHLLVIGSNWSNKLRSAKDNFSKNFSSNLYEYNVCLDLGSNSGSLSLYPRSIEILENNGALFQLKQADSYKIFKKKNEKKFTFTNFNNLISKGEKLLNDSDFFFDHIKSQQLIFKNPHNEIFKQLDKFYK